MGSNRFRVDMPRFVDFYLQGKLHLDDMISNRIALADINEGMAALETGEIAAALLSSTNNRQKEDSTMRWLSFLRGGNETFGYVVADADGSEGVVDAGARSEFVSLREAIEADALAHLPDNCGNQADVSGGY